MSDVEVGESADRSDLRAFYGWAIDRGLMDVDPSAKLGSIKVPQALPRPFGDDVLGALTIGQLRTRRMVGLGLYAGLRCAEIAALQAQDVWLHSLPPVLVVRNGKGGKDRTIAMAPALVDLLRGTPSSGPVFPGRAAAAVRPATVSALIRRHLTRAGVDGTAHQLRHTFGTEFARQAGGSAGRPPSSGSTSTNGAAGSIGRGCMCGSVTKPTPTSWRAWSPSSGRPPS